MNYYPAPRPMTMGAVPSGPAGIAATLKIMVAMARQWRKDGGVRELATQLVRDLPQYDTVGEVRALHAFVRDHIRYTGDIRDVETVQDPRATLQLGVGDCDDKSLLLASLLESINHPARFVAFKVGASGQWHVLTQTKLGQKWVTLETIRPVDIGWNPNIGLTKGMVAHI